MSLLLGSLELLIQINLIDGLDGLSSGISAISFGTMAILAAYQGELFVAIMSCLLLGSTLGFLVHNFHPAKIFYGGYGFILFLGFFGSFCLIVTRL